MSRRRKLLASCPGRQHRQSGIVLRNRRTREASKGVWARKKDCAVKTKIGAPGSREDIAAAPGALVCKIVRTQTAVFRAGIQRTSDAWEGRILILGRRASLRGLRINFRRPEQSAQSIGRVRKVRRQAPLVGLHAQSEKSFGDSKRQWNFQLHPCQLPVESKSCFLRGKQGIGARYPDLHHSHPAHGHQNPATSRGATAEPNNVAVLSIARPTVAQACHRPGRPGPMGQSRLRLLLIR